MHIALVATCAMANYAAHICACEHLSDITSLKFDSVFALFCNQAPPFRPRGDSLTAKSDDSRDEKGLIS